MKAAAPAADDLPDTPYVFETDEDEPEPAPVKPKKKEKKQADVVTYTVLVEKPAARVAEPSVTSAKPVVTPFVPKVATPKTEKQESSIDTSGYNVGTKITHKKFGDGVITEIRESTNGPLITVRFAAGGIKTLSLQIVLENHVIEKL